ncbi:MAG TPA: transglutaminase family protein, partial [Candidatus Binatia bacterium]
MSIHVALHHVTHYRYDRRINLGPQVLRLRPAPHCRTRILSYSLRVSPSQHFINWQQDPQANYLARLVFPETTNEFRIEVDLVVEMAIINPFDFFLEPQAENFPFEYESWQRDELAPYMKREPLTPLFERYLGTIPRKQRRCVDFFVDLNRQLSCDVKYLIRLEPGVQTPEETLAKGSGSCRDSGWLLVQLLRHLGLAARFVSGYLIQLTPDVKSLDGPSGPEKDFTDLHAWAEVYLPGAGWIGLDPTSGLFAGEGHLPLACTPEPRSASPVTGTVDECKVDFSHEMSITRIWEAPRVTKPYTEEQWAAIDRLGRGVDARLTNNDVRLTMGGEPTFVSMDDPDGEEWNTAALGPTKRRLAADLYHRLRQRYGKKGLVHFGQGKWYPGEQLPRWSLNCFWRADGEPIWRDEALIADETRPGTATNATAGLFLTQVAERLGLDSRLVFPAYEDLFYYMWRERKLPANVDPFDSRLEDPLERARLMRVFTQGLDQIVGYGLPVARDPATERWRTGRWFLRSELCYLIPGDSPMGYRLPLDSLPWTSTVDYPYVFPPDLSRPLPPLAPHSQIRFQVDSARVADAEPSRGRAGKDNRDDATRVARQHESAAWITRAA